jgi:hypothetical protein
MRNSDVEELFELVDVGDVVELRLEKSEDISLEPDATPAVVAEE